MRKRIYDLLQTLFVAALLITAVLGFILFVVQFIAMLMLNGALAEKVYNVLINPMCLCAAFTAICGALRPYVRGKAKFDNEPEEKDLDEGI